MAKKMMYHYFSSPDANIVIGLLGDDPKELARQVSVGILRGLPVYHLPDHPSELNDKMFSGAPINTFPCAGHAPRVVESGSVKMTMPKREPVSAVDSVKSMIREAFSA